LFVTEVGGVPDKSISFETTLMVRDTCLCLAVQRAARALARRFDEALAGAGLTNGQFSLLMALNRPPSSKGGPPPMAPVAALLAMDRTTLTAALKPLERRGLVRIAVDPKDRRGRRLVLTAKGRKALAKAMPAWRREHQAVEKDLISADALRQALGILAGM
jgi:DNA-binding MarR family transcriptional regulator